MSKREPNAGDELPPELEQRLLSALRSVPLDDATRERLRAGMLQRARERAPEGTSTVRAQPAAWVRIGPGVEARVVHVDDRAKTHLSLIRMQAGAIVPPHRHQTEEEIMVLEGECRIGAHRLAVGDTHIASKGSWHDAVTTDAGVLVLLRGEYPYPGAEPKC